jgi:hypothetical protein
MCLHSSLVMCNLSNVTDRRATPEAASAIAADIAAAKAAGSNEESLNVIRSRAADIEVETFVRAGGLLSLSPRDLLGVA